MSIILLHPTTVVTPASKTHVVYWSLHRHVVRCERAGNPPFQPLESALAGFFVLTVLMRKGSSQVSVKKQNRIS